ncbi:MAG: cell division FtsA domain-containing protein, partial [Terracidiphilus sp.]
MRVGEQLREIWRQATRHGRQAGSGRKAELMAGAADADAERKTLALPAILSPVQFPGRLLPKPTPVNLRRFAETPVVRRAINVIIEQEMGVGILDIGGGTSDFAIYKDGRIRHSKVIPIAGNHFTNDLAVGFGIPFNKAEEIK